MSFSVVLVYKGSTPGVIIDAASIYTAKNSKIFPGYFYADNANGVVEATNLNGDLIIYTSWQVPVATVRDLVTPKEDLVRTLVPTDGTRVLLDLKKMKVVDTDKIFYRGPHREDGNHLFLSEVTNEVYMFPAENPREILFTLNWAARFLTLPKKEAISMQGKTLITALCSRYFVEKISEDSLSRISTIEFPSDTPEGRTLYSYREESLKELKEFSPRGSKTKISLANLINTGTGLPNGLIAHSKKYPTRKILISIDFLQSYIKEAFILNGELWVDMDIEKDMEIVDELISKLKLSLIRFIS